MAQSKYKRATAIQNSIRQVLYRDWDPIGVSGDWPEDEYDRYIAPVYRILVGSRSEDELIDFFFKSEIENIGESHDSREKLRLVARKLLAIDVKL